MTVIFPSIEHLDEVLAAIDGREEFMVHRNRRGYTQRDEAASFALLKDKGMQLNLDVEPFRTVCTAVWAKFPERFRPDLLRLAQA